MKTTNWDAVAASAPLDAQASVVRDGSGDLFETKINAGAQAHWKAPPPPLASKPNAGLPDLTGHRFGRLVVVRFHGATSKNNPVPTWLVRCACGDYELRRTKTILNPGDPDDCCLECRAVRILQKRASAPNNRKARRKAAALLDQLAAGAKAA